MRRKMNSRLLTGLIITGLMLAVILLGTFWTPYVPTAMKYGKFSPPSAAHIFGTDNFGRDIFSRVLKGSGTTLAIALSTVSIGALAGTLIGAVTGYLGGAADEILMRLNDALTAFPSFLLALLIVSLVGPGKKYSVVLALGLVFIPSFARVMRAEFATLRGRNFVTGARLMGASNGRILLIHLLPNTVRVLLPALTIGFNNAVLAEASMSFLGIGVRPPDASLGYMLSEAQGMLAKAPWYALFTGLTIVLLVFGVGLIGEGLQMQDREVA
ncbi:MAG: ABC transporter permease [Oscillospiraceae bacterium]|nr:ABC transporter permease [Oscillospiraceae bacterium]